MKNKLNNKGFSLIELMVIIVITSLLAVNISKLTNVSQTQSYNNNLKYNIDYLNNYINNLSYSNVEINRDIENKINRNEKGNELIKVDFKIPYMKFSYKDDGTIELEKRKIIYSKENNIDKDGIIDKFELEDIGYNNSKFQLINKGKIDKIILLKNKANNLLIDYTRNSLNQNDYIIRDKENHILYSLTYDDNLGEYIEINNFEDNGYLDTFIYDSKNITNTIKNYNLDFFYINQLGSNKKCLIFRDKGSSYFNDIISKNLIFHDFLEKNYNFEDDQGLKFLDSSGIINEGSNYCDYNDFIILIQNY